MDVSEREGSTANILVVDDTHANLHLLAEILAQEGYSVRPVPNGTLALASVRIALPDLILLDIMMPDLSGYEVCERLKADVRTCEVPIIFISALHEAIEKTKAFRVGGVDYITKPFQPEEVLARVETHLTLRNVQRALQHKNRRLEQEILERQHAEDALQQLNVDLEHRVEYRTRQLKQSNDELQEALDRLKNTQEQLIQSEKMSLLVSLVAGVAHEINTPVGVGVTAASYLEQVTKEFGMLYHSGTIKRSELEAYIKTVTEAAHIILQNMQLASQRTQSFKEVAVDQVGGKKRRFDLKSYIDEVLLNLKPKLKNTSHTVTVNCPDGLFIHSYPGAFSQIISNLIMNSLLHGFEHKEQGEISLNVSSRDELLFLDYRDNGKGMTHEHCSRVFEAFFTTKREQGGSGLGMNIVQNLVTRKLRGQIECESEPGVMTRFLIRLPLELTASDDERESESKEGLFANTL